MRNLYHFLPHFFPQLHRRFFARVDRVLRRSLGVSESAKSSVKIKPAPEKAAKEDTKNGSPSVDDYPDNFDDVVMPMDGDGKFDASDFVDWKDFKASMKDKKGEEPVKIKMENVGMPPVNKRDEL